MKKIYYLYFALILGLLCSPLLSAQTTKWVDQAGGSDANDGNTEATAYATLQFAIDNSTSGTVATRSVVNVKDGTYGSSGSGSSCEGFPGAILIKDLDYLTIQAGPGHEPVVAPTTAIEVNVVSIVVENSDHLIIDNIDSDQTVAQFDNWHYCSDDLTVRNSFFEGGEDGIDFSGNLTAALIENNDFIDINTGNGDEVLDFTDNVSYSNVVIQDNNFKNNYRQVTINPGVTASNFTIRRNIMDGTTSQEAIRLIGASSIVIENNVIMNNRQQGVYIDNGCSDITIRHNSFFNNDLESGPNGEIRTKVTSSDIVIKNNIIYGNGSNPAFETGVNSLLGEDYNLVYNTTDIGSFTFGSNTITGLNPLFVSTTAGSEDLHLQPSSPALEAGLGLGVVDDIEKNPRPQPVSSNPDLGAYEHPATSLEVAIDIKPQSCPNPLNVKSKGVLPVAILGSTDLDVNNIDVSSIILKGVAPNRSTVEDVSTPVVNGEECECTTDGPDGFDDLTLKFDTQEIVDALGSVNDGDELVLTITGNLLDGTPIEGSDCVIIKAKGKLRKHLTGNSSNVPEEYALFENFPNPFNPSTTIQFAVPEQSFIKLEVYNSLGERVTTLVAETLAAGIYTVNWNAADLPSGVYIYSIQSRDFFASKKMILMK